MKPPRALLACLSLLLLMLPATAGAGPLESSCRLGPQPAASLLLPYFEVDLDNPEGPTTLMSIGNSSGLPVLARVTLWSDWAIPVYSFDLALPGNGLQTLNLRDVIERGRLPETNIEGQIRGNCSAPLENPSLRGAVRAEIQKWLTGQPASSDGLCRASDRGETSLAVGYATVDVLTDCSEILRYATDEGYFAADGTGLAGYDNVLYGDWFLVDSSRDLSQGAELVHVVADPEFFEGKTLPTFYGGFTDDPTADARRPSSSEWQARFFEGGAFDGGTEFLLWLNPLSPVEPRPCGSGVIMDNVFAPVHQFRIRTEEGTNFFDTNPTVFRTSPALTRRFQTDELFIPDSTTGLLEITSYATCPICSPPEQRTLQAWVIPIYSAEQRFSIGTNAVQLNDLCVEP